MSKDPDDCLHIRLHPARVDGATTVCLDCRTPINVCRFQYSSGEPIEAQFDRLLEQLREELIRNPHAY